ncbi:unnamed protein product, partial [Phaeothamnion confervicola]
TSSLSGARVLELGAGVGIAGMLAARLRAAEVALTDGDACCVPLLAKSAKDNGLANVVAARLLWGDAKSTADECHTADAAASGASPPPMPLFNVILAGDVLYKPDLIDPLLTTAAAFLAPRGTFLLCHIPRAGVTHDTVAAALAAAGFAFEAHRPSGDGVRAEMCAEDAARAMLYTAT